jgi:hypothetical protein
MRFAARKTDSAWVTSRGTWAALGALAVSATARAILRSRHPASTEPMDAPASTEPDATPDGRRPDVLLDVDELRVDKINLEVDALRAHVAVLAALGTLLDLSIGVDARLRGVNLEIEGVEAKVVLKARLKHIRAILEKALETVGEHPEILRILSRSLDRATRESLGDAQASLLEVLAGLKAGDTVDEALLGRLEEVRKTLQEILNPSEIGNDGEAAQRALGAG